MLWFPNKVAHQWSRIHTRERVIKASRFFLQFQGYKIHSRVKVYCALVRFTAKPRNAVNSTSDAVPSPKRRVNTSTSMVLSIYAYVYRCDYLGIHCFMYPSFCIHKYYEIMSFGWKIFCQGTLSAAPADRCGNVVCPRGEWSHQDILWQQPSKWTAFNTTHQFSLDAFILVLSYSAPPGISKCKGR